MQLAEVLLASRPGALVALLVEAQVVLAMRVTTMFLEPRGRKAEWPLSQIHTIAVMMTIMTAIMTTTNTVHPPEVLTKVAKAVTKEDIAVIEMNLVVAGTVLVVVSVDKLVAEVTEVNPAGAEMAGMAEVNLVGAGTAEVVLEVAGVRLDAAEALHAVNQNPNPNSNKNPNHNSNISPSSVPSAGVRLRKKSTLHLSSNGNLNRLKLIPRAKIWLLSLVDRARFELAASTMPR